MSLWAGAVYSQEAEKVLWNEIGPHERGVIMMSSVRIQGCDCSGFSRNFAFILSGLLQRLSREKPEQITSLLLNFSQQNSKNRVWVRMWVGCLFLKSHPVNDGGILNATSHLSPSEWETPDWSITRIVLRRLSGNKIFTLTQGKRHFLVQYFAKTALGIIYQRNITLKFLKFLHQTHFNRQKWILLKNVHTSWIFWFQIWTSVKNLRH